MKLRVLQGWVLANHREIRAYVVAFATVIGAIIIPWTIYKGQDEATERHEKASRKIGIVQIISSVCEKDCKHQLSTNELIKKFSQVILPQMN